MKIRFFTDFCSSEEAARTFIAMNGYDPSWFVSDNSFTHVILLNTPMPDISHIPPKNVVGLACEPTIGIITPETRTPFLRITPQFIAYAQRHVGRYLIGDATGLPAPFESHHGYMWHKGITTPIHPEPRHGVSLMVSEKKSLPGHRYRHTLVEEILRRDLPVDIWGRCVPMLKQIYGDRPQLKSSFTSCIGTLLGKYKYCVAIENIQQDSYISEKFSDCIMTETVPIYLGSSRIDELYGPGACVHLTGRVEDDIKIIETACADTDGTVPPALKAARDTHLTSPKINLFRAIECDLLFPK